MYIFITHISVIIFVSPLNQRFWVRLSPRWRRCPSRSVPAAIWGTDLQEWWQVLREPMRVQPWEGQLALPSSVAASILASKPDCSGWIPAAYWAESCSIGRDFVATEYKLKLLFHGLSRGRYGYTLHTIHGSVRPSIFVTKFQARPRIPGPFPANFLIFAATHRAVADLTGLGWVGQEAACREDSPLNVANIFL